MHPFARLETKLRRTAKAIVHGDEVAPIDLLGVNPRAHAADERTYVRAAALQAKHRVFRHETIMIMNVMALLRPGTVFVDCGANIGLWALSICRAGQLLGGVRVLAFEPHPATFARLASAGSAWPGFEAHNVALWSKPGWIELQAGVGSGTHGIASDALQDSGARLRVEAATLDSYLDGLDDVIIKVDVEGAELALLEGCGDTLGRDAIRAIYVDGIRHQDRNQVTRLLADAGFSLLEGQTLRPAADDDYALLALKAGAPDPTKPPVRSLARRT